MKELNKKIKSNKKKQNHGKTSLISAKIIPINHIIENKINVENMENNFIFVFMIYLLDVKYYLLYDI